MFGETLVLGFASFAPADPLARLCSGSSTAFVKRHHPQSILHFIHLSPALVVNFSHVLGHHHEVVKRQFGMLDTYNISSSLNEGKPCEKATF